MTANVISKLLLSIETRKFHHLAEGGNRIVHPECFLSKPNGIIIMIFCIWTANLHVNSYTIKSNGGASSRKTFVTFRVFMKIAARSTTIPHDRPCAVMKARRHQFDSPWPVLSFRIHMCVCVYRICATVVVRTVYPPPPSNTVHTHTITRPLTFLRDCLRYIIGNIFSTLRLYAYILVEPLPNGSTYLIFT